jgi:cellobiose-specific phosphotransferase system component IIA
VSRLTTSEGGFVQSSHVDEGEKMGEATLTLSLPSAKLSDTLASLGQLAPVRSESQSLQDITNTYDAARQRLSDATAERQALLRALARASTEGEIDSLRERLAQNRGSIAEAHTAFQAVSQRASTAEVEVTVVGDKNAGSEGLTLHRGLHDAGRVLTVTLVILLIAAAVLLPLTLVAIALATARRAWRRHQRERVLGG